MKLIRIDIHVRRSGDSNIARLRHNERTFTASSTNSPFYAAQAALYKAVSKRHVLSLGAAGPGGMQHAELFRAEVFVKEPSAAARPQGGRP